MFFLGVAGSFLPYLIGFGVLFFLSIGINNKHAIEFAELEEKKIDNYSINDSSLPLAEDCYIFSQHQTKKDSNQKAIEAPIVFEYTGMQAHLNRMCFDVFIAASSNYKTHSGLSPPCLIS